MDEPHELGDLIAGFATELLGAILVRPSCAFGTIASQLNPDELPEALGCVLALLRSKPTSGTSALLVVCHAANLGSLDIADAVSRGFVWHSEWYAANLLVLCRRRRKFWVAAKKAMVARYRLLDPIDHSTKRLPVQP